MISVYFCSLCAECFHIKLPSFFLNFGLGYLVYILHICRQRAAIIPPMAPTTWENKGWKFHADVTSESIRCPITLLPLTCFDLCKGENRQGKEQFELLLKLHGQARDSNFKTKLKTD